ncbi:MAG TPA: DNA-processing protein DprA [Solirubrobacteraceae bacterium]|nr:DNA-processing protein DprA [Solirubrobacteraceae bacterium]
MSRGGCTACRLRSRLLAELTPLLDLRCRDRSRLVELLACEDLELIDRLGGRRRDELSRTHSRGLPSPERSPPPAICVHDRHFPRRLRAADGPRLLYTSGDGGLLRTGGERPAVALLGTTRPSPHGAELSASLADGLARSGVVVVTLMTDGIPRWVRSGVERSGAGAVALTADGLEPEPFPALRGGAPRKRPSSCRAAELPPGCHGRRWGRLAAERTAAALSDLVLVLETEPGRELFGVERARASGVRVAAVPGRPTEPLAQGPLQLLREGASLVRCAEDVLELLGRRPLQPPTDGVRGRRMPALLTGVLDRVAGGEETPEQLLTGADRDRMLLGLAQLELLGRVRRTHDGRYVATPDRLR